MFNDSRSHYLKLEESKISSIIHKGLEEMAPSEFLEPDHEDLLDYFIRYKRLLEKSIIYPLLESNNAVVSNFYSSLIKVVNF